MSLKNKFAVITGASSGIGLESARVFAEGGCRLFLGARRIDRLAEIKSELEKLGAPSVGIQALDVTSDQSVLSFCQQALEISTPDILLNNAGMAKGVDHLADGNVDDWQVMIDTNLMGVLRVTRGFLNKMKDSKSGHIIMMGSIAGHFSYEGGGVYCASKHGLMALTKTLKLELNGYNIRVTTIDPGMVQTEFSDVRLGDKSKAENVYNGLTPLTGRDIAECVAFAASRPPHVNIDDIIIMPTQQATVYKVDRNS